MLSHSPLSRPPRPRPSSPPLDPPPPIAAASPALPLTSLLRGTLSSPRLLLPRLRPSRPSLCSLEPSASSLVFFARLLASLVVLRKYSRVFRARTARQLLPTPTSRSKKRLEAGGKVATRGEDGNPDLHSSPNRAEALDTPGHSPIILPSGLVPKATLERPLPPSLPFHIVSPGVPGCPSFLPQSALPSRVAKDQLRSPGPRGQQQAFCCDPDSRFHALTAHLL